MLPDSWVNAIFARLTMRYGAAFLRQYQDIDPEAVKADWSHVLDGFEKRPEAIKHAMENLPEMPLNALQFRTIARRAPEANAPKLPEPKADATVVASVCDALKNVSKGIGAKHASPAQECIDKIEAVVRNRGGAISSAQKHMVGHCLRMSGTSTALNVAAEV